MSKLCVITGATGHIGYALLGDQLHLVAREVVGADIKEVRELE